MVNSNSTCWNGHEKIFSVIVSASVEFSSQKQLSERSVGWLFYQWCYFATGFLHFPSRLEGLGHQRCAFFEQCLLVSPCGLISE